MRKQKGSRDSTRQYVPVHGKDINGAPVGAHGEHPGHEVNGHLLWPCHQDVERELAELCVALGVTTVV